MPSEPQSAPSTINHPPRKPKFSPTDCSTRVLVVFAALQALDVITTILGWRLGAQESNIVVARFMQLGPVTGLIAAKLLGLLLVVAILVRDRLRLLRFVNLWFAAIVAWNLIIIWVQKYSR